MIRGIALQQDDKHIHLLAKRVALAVEARGGYALPWKRTLFLDPGIHVPWALLSAGFDFLDTWECAAPVWSYEVTVADIAQGADRVRSEALIGDLRVPLYAWELLFARQGEASAALLEAWQAEMAAAPGGDPRIAFTRALYIAKPLFLALPRSWLTTAKESKKQPVTLGARTARGRAIVPADLVRVEVAKGRFIKCKAGDEERVKAEWVFRHLPRRERRAK